MIGLRSFLDPRRSKLRPYLAQLALKNHQLLKDGKLVGNNPSITWYLKHLKRFHITENYQGVRKQLIKMEDFGLLKKQRNIRPICTLYFNQKRLTRLPHAEFYLNEKYAAELGEVLQEIIQNANKKANKPPVFV